MNSNNPCVSSLKRHPFIVILLALLTSILMAQAQQPAILTNGLVAHYPFNGNAKDASGNGNNGTILAGGLTTDRFGISSNAFNIPADNTGWNWGLETTIITA